MAIAINGSTNVITGVAVGGLPDGIVDADMLAADSVTDGKLNISGEVKAWVHFRGTGTVTILANFNVSSITDHNTGDFTITKAKEIHKTNIRNARTPKLTELDIEFQKALETSSSTTDIVSKKQALRDAPADSGIASADTEAKLKAQWNTSILGDSPYS